MNLPRGKQCESTIQVLYFWGGFKSECCGDVCLRCDCLIGGKVSGWQLEVEHVALFALQKAKDSVRAKCGEMVGQPQLG